MQRSMRSIRSIGIQQLGCVFLWLASGFAYGESGDVHVPEALRDWRGWVLHDQRHQGCPFLFDGDLSAREHFVCAWPGTLRIDITADSGQFEQEWAIHGDAQWVPLPGDGEVWPHAVMADGRALQVVLRQGAPTVRLPPGRHRLSGAFAWSERPAALVLPASIGLLALRLDGADIALPRRDGGVLWLGEGEDVQAVDELSVRVYRRIEDEVPTRLQTLLEVDASGAMREERIGPALPEGFTPISLASELPVRLTPDGSLLVQVRPGSWTIDLLARAPDVLAGIAMPAPQHNLPEEEVWSYQARPNLRATRPEGPRSVDPQRVGAPWEDLPAFRMAPGETLRIVERHRGQAGTDNDLRLERELWLDFDGRGFVFADRIFGQMRTGWRLDMAPPYLLMSASDSSEHNLLVTRGGVGAGIEIRQPRLDIPALGRIAGLGEIPVAGWSADFDAVKARLHLPPGHKLLTALGVDAAPTSWTGRWRLLDLFVLLITAAATLRLFGRAAGLVALLALTMSFHEPAAPVWSWLNLLAAVALARAAPAGRLLSVAKVYRRASFVMLLFLLTPFLVGQIRSAVYPQLAPEWAGQARDFKPVERQRADEVQLNLEPELSGLPSDAAGKAIVGRAQEELTGPGSPSRQAPLLRYEEGTLVPAGPGRPAWQWSPHQLNWNGPVEAGRTLRLVILPDWLVSALRLLAVALLGLLAAWFAFDVLGREWSWRNWKWRFPAFGAPTASMLAILAVGMGAAPAQAETPPPEVLRELQERLLAPPPCAPRCAEIVNAHVDVGEQDLAVQLEVHALADVAVSMPGALDGWRPQGILNNSADALPGRLDGHGVLWVRLPAGRHRLTLRGPLPAGDALEIPFPTSPRTIAAKSKHWVITGIDKGVLTSGALNLVRLRRQVGVEAAAQWGPSQFPAFLHIDRTHYLLLDWTVNTTVRRVAPQTGALNIEVPLVEGEAVLSEGVVVKDGYVVVSMNPAQEVFEWTSSLTRRPAMALRAPARQPWREVWRFVIGDAWRVAFSGVPESEPDPRADRRIAEFHPRPGEALEIDITRPTAVEGGTLAFDQVLLDTRVGDDLRTSSLTMDYRSTRGAAHGLQLPKVAKLRSVSTDGETLSLNMEEGALNLPILPGEHRVRVVWDEGLEAGFRVRIPEVALNAPSSNIVSTLEMPHNRWLLFANGPSLGPAILYWSELLALIAAALILGRIKLTPLGTWHWLLLGLGFSTFSWLGLALVAAWLLAQGARSRWGERLTARAYNASQIGLALLTIGAFAAIITGIQIGLLGSPDMHVAGFESYGRQLSWFADQTDAVIPRASVWSLPLWVYKALILVWALWLSFALLRWLPWAWQCFAGPGLWRKPAAAGKAVAASVAGPAADR